MAKRKSTKGQTTIYIIHNMFNFRDTECAICIILVQLKSLKIPKG